MRDICERGLGGVILFDKAIGKKGARKNIVSPAQLRRLTKKLSSCSKHPLIAIDQEGGLVQRLKSADGFFGRYPKASVIVTKREDYARKIYTQMAKELKNMRRSLDRLSYPMNKSVFYSAVASIARLKKDANIDRLIRRLILEKEKV